MVHQERISVTIERLNFRIVAPFDPNCGLYLLASSNMEARDGAKVMAFIRVSGRSELVMTYRVVYPILKFPDGREDETSTPFTIPAAFITALNGRLNREPEPEVGNAEETETAPTPEQGSESYRPQDKRSAEG